MAGKKGTIPWNKGKVGIYSKETLKKMSDNGKGRIPYNKGLTKETHESLMRTSIKVSGKNNPMFGKIPHNKGNHNKSIKSKCLTCKKEFYYYIGTSIGKFCSPKCFGKYYSGDKNPYWNNGSPSSYYGRVWKLIRIEVLRKYRNRCQNCGSRERLQIHHIIPFKEVGVHSLDNLIPLCISCHKREEWKIVKSRRLKE